MAQEAAGIWPTVNQVRRFLRIARVVVKPIRTGILVVENSLENCPPIGPGRGGLARRISREPPEADVILREIKKAFAANAKKPVAFTPETIGFRFQPHHLGRGAQVASLRPASRPLPFPGRGRRPFAVCARMASTRSCCRVTSCWI